MNFADLWARGYTSLVPIIPPSAPPLAKMEMCVRYNQDTEGFFDLLWL